MQDAIEKLLILQDRDRTILRFRQELEVIPQDRNHLTSKASSSQSALEAAKHQVNHLESGRKSLELEAESKRIQMEKYQVQQFQTKKNDEFRAIGNEIETAKKVIFEIENRIIENMEQAEVALKQLADANKLAAADKKLMDDQVANLNAQETNLQKQLAEVEANRAALCSSIDPGLLNRYDRLLRNKGGSVVVSVEHGVCGGCHMQLSRQTVVSCRAQQEIIPCTNCGRILYYTAGMDVDIVD